MEMKMAAMQEKTVDTGKRNAINNGGIRKLLPGGTAVFLVGVLLTGGLAFHSPRNGFAEEVTGQAYTAAESENAEEVSTDVPGAAGSGEVIMLMNPDDVMNLVNLPNPMTYYFDIDEDGTEDELSIGISADELYGAPQVVTVSCRGNAATEKTEYNEGLEMIAPYLVRANGRTYLYLFFVSQIYDQFLQVWDVSGETPVCAGILPDVWLLGGGYERYSDQFDNPFSFQMESQWSTLARLILRRTYHIGEDGMPVPDTEFADCMIGVVHEDVYTLQDVPCEIIEDTPLENVPQSGTPAICPAGTKLVYRYADYGRRIDMMGEDGTIYRFTADEDNYHAINGREAAELFSGLSYWG